MAAVTTTARAGGDSEPRRPTLVKICGVTNREDAHAAIEAGADAIGFIAVAESARYVSAQAFLRIREVLPSDFPVVVVARRLCDASKYHAPIVQYYEESEMSPGLDAETLTIRVVRVRDEAGAEQARRVPDTAGAVLLDGFQAGSLGGSGTRVDWSLVSHLPRDLELPVILAGGLGPANVADALSIVGPYAVDVSSGVEDRTEGKKNHEMIRAFVRAVREWDRSGGASETRHRFLEPS